MALIIKMSCSGADSSTGKNDCMIVSAGSSTGKKKMNKCDE